MESRCRGLLGEFEVVIAASQYVDEIKKISPTDGYAALVAWLEASLADEYKGMAGVENEVALRWLQGKIQMLTVIIKKMKEF